MTQELLAEASCSQSSASADISLMQTSQQCLTLLHRSEGRLQARLLKLLSLSTWNVGIVPNSSNTIMPAPSHKKVMEDNFSQSLAALEVLIPAQEASSLLVTAPRTPQGETRQEAAKQIAAKLSSLLDGLDRWVGLLWPNAQPVRFDHRYQKRAAGEILQTQYIQPPCTPRQQGNIKILSSVPL